MFSRLLLLALLGLASSEKTYDGYKVLRTETLTSEQARELRDLHLYDFWKQANTGRNAEIMVGPQDLEVLQGILKELGVEYTYKTEDVQELINQSRSAPKNKKQPGWRINYTEYNTHDEINAYLEELAAANDFVSTKSAGLSVEGRDMKVLQIEKAGAGAPNIWIEAGIHAREWIAPAVAIWTIRELLEIQEDPTILDKFNFYIIPVANPDGYEYSMSNDRLWRKNRGDNNGDRCKGVDLNRNFGYHYDEAGVSHDPCSDIYDGTEAFSEAEAQNLRDYFNTLSPVPRSSVCFHSAAELWLWPYGYAYDTYPPQYEDIRDLAEACCDALNAVNGQNFVAINSAELYPAAGAADDYYESQGSKYTYTPELRDGGFGFLLPADQIEPSGKEVWAAWKTIFATVEADPGL